MSAFIASNVGCSIVTADFGKEQTPFSPFYIGCNGSERSINMCSKQRNVVECEVAAGVICDGRKTSGYEPHKLTGIFHFQHIAH